MRGGIASLDTWVERNANSGAQVYFDATAPRDEILARRPNWVKAKTNPELAARLIGGAVNALNANFYLGGRSGSRFNWVGAWTPPDAVCTGVTTL